MKSIYSRLISVYFISIILAVTISGAISTQRNNVDIVKQADNELSESSNYICSLLNSYSDIELHQLLSNYSNCTNMSFTIIDEFGNNINYGDISISLSKKEIDKLLNSKNKSIITSNKSYRQLTSVYTLNNNQRYIVMVEYNLSEAMNNFYENGIVTILCVVIPGSLVFLLFADIIVKPISKLTKANNELAKGNYHVRVNYSGNDEISELNRSFNRMASVLDKQEKTRQQFISDVSHEFQTPLTAISGFAKILKEESLTETQRKKYADIILFQSNRLSSLAKNMLQLTMLDSDTIDLNIENYNLKDQLDRVVESHLPIALNKNIEIEYICDKDEYIIDADQSRLEQVWNNLFSNAIKYTQENGVITLTLKKSFSEIEVSLADTGIGMNKDALTHIFDRFYREDKSRGIEGNGLGLSIVKRIVDLHGYKIDVSSVVDGGSVFTIHIPITHNLLNLRKG